MIEIAPSIIAADYKRLGDALREIAEGGADMIHVDVMDGQFVPNITIGPPVAASLGEGSSLPLDCHLMIASPERWISDFLDAGARRISVHAEACTHLHRALGAIREGGAEVGLALNPGTPVESIREVARDIDVLLIMSVNPGFSGQSFIEESIDKVARGAALLSELGSEASIQVDGGVGAGNVGELVRAGARRFVAGSSVFAGGNAPGAIGSLRRAAEGALQ